jgi:hypothetical protein
MAKMALDGECYFCTALCGEEDYCTGCNEFVCPDCDEIPFEDLLPGHEPEEHVGEWGE